MDSVRRSLTPAPVHSTPALLCSLRIQGQPSGEISRQIRKQKCNQGLQSWLTCLKLEGTERDEKGKVSRAPFALDVILAAAREHRCVDPRLAINWHDDFLGISAVLARQGACRDSQRHDCREDKKPQRHRALHGEGRRLERSPDQEPPDLEVAALEPFVHFSEASPPPRHAGPLLGALPGATHRLHPPED